MRPDWPLESGAKLGREALKSNRPTGFLIVWLLCLLLAPIFETGNHVLAQGKPLQLFSDYRSNGTLVIKSKRTGEIWTHNADRANRRFIPASTFKIPNTLIALDAGAVTSADQLFKWDGVIRWLNKWNQDLTLKQAFRASSVPVYQRIARDIGSKRMKTGLARIGYGNQQIGKAIDRFWLDGPLKISAVEQVGLMEKIAESALPFSPGHQSVLKKVMAEKSGPGWALFGKTGWTRAPNPDVGWYVGWLETKSDRLYFALNMDMTRKGQRTVRRKIVVDALRKITNLQIR